MSPGPTLHVIIVSYASSDVIIPCLESLRAATYKNIRVVVVDNGSPDDSADIVAGWGNALGDFEEIGVTDDGVIAAGQPGTWLTLIRSRLNRGYAGGVNTGIKYMERDKQADLFWVLNPDCEVSAATPGLFVQKATENPGFGLIGGRTLSFDIDEVQSDGGKVNPWTGMVSNLGLGASASVAGPDSSELDYVSGASLVFSRRFLETAGYMQEDYFLYFEEVDWAFRRGNLPILYASGTEVYHHVGTSIGSATLRRRPSGFANYFNFRNRIRFVWRFRRSYIATAFMWSFAKAGSLILRGAFEEGHGAFRGLLQMSPPIGVRDRIAPDSQPLAFGKK